MKKYCYYNGKILSIEKALIPVNDIGFLRGFGVFDYIKAYDGVPFLLKEHVARLKRSAASLGLKLPLKEKEIIAITMKLLAKHKAPRAGIRIIITGGTSSGGLLYEQRTPTFLVLIEDLVELPTELFAQGARLMSFEHERLFPEIKTLNYINAVKLQKERIKKKAIEILYTHKGIILEATTSNFFLIKDKKLLTTKNSVLKGITRQHVIDLAQKRGFTIEQRDIMLTELGEADEAFITSTNKEVLPIIAVDSIKIGTGKVGPKTKELHQAFSQSIQTYVRRNSAYRTK